MERKLRPEIAGGKGKSPKIISIDEICLYKSVYAVKKSENNE